MTTVALHPVPRWGDVAVEQVRTVGLALRREMIILLVILGVFGALTAASIARVLAASSGSVSVGDGVQLTVPMMLIGLVTPFAVWRDERPSRRDYHHAMPVARAGHTLTKLLAGWCWLVLAVALCLLFVAGLELVSVRLTGGSSGVAPAWSWMVPVTSASVAYLLSSAAVVGSDHPWRWVGGAVVLPALLTAISMTAQVRQLDTMLDTITHGHYGMEAAIFGDIRVASGSPHEFRPAQDLMSARRATGIAPEVVMRGHRILLQPTVPSVERWLGATLLWGALGMVLVGIATVRRAE